MKYKITAVIPVQQYGNLQPSIEIDTSDIKEAHTEAMEHINSVWSKYGTKPLEGRKADSMGNYAQIKTFTGEDILYNDDTHSYTDLQGNKLVSASGYKKQFEKPFPLDSMAEKVAVKNKIEDQVVKDMWASNGKISCTFGNVIHYAMEHYWRFKDSPCGEKEYHLSKNPLIRQIVKNFPEHELGFKDVILPEVFISSIKNKACGQIDAIHILCEKKVNLWDYKSDANLTKEKLRIHFIQLSYYARILKVFKYDINKIIVWNYTIEGWKAHESEPLNLKELENENR